MTSFAVSSAANLWQNPARFETGPAGHDGMGQGLIQGTGDNIDLPGHGSATLAQSGRAMSARFIDATGFFINYGSIVGRLYPPGNIGPSIEIGSSLATATFWVVNYGSITGNPTAILHSGGATDTLIVVNRGTIIGGFYSDGSIFGGYYSGDSKNSVDIIQNRGEMIGKVVTGGGDDTVDNRYGSIRFDIDMGDGNDRYVALDHGSVDGVVYGNGGADTFFGNQTSVERFSGGDGVDTLDFRFGGAVTLALDLSFAPGDAALGDQYIEMENVFGSDIGDDVIRGDGLANALFGFGGNDSLDGAGGNDVLRGGVGIDTLTGGTGNDTFRFSGLDECGDQITDFGNTVGDNDRFQITAAAFGGGLVAGVLAASQFQTRTDNLAQDADDRFIFNITDRTLWFDADGNGAGAAIMVADLQAGAVVTAADILLI
ncbi:MAG: calcium-binding protein [Paracoccaceae bacterium]